MSSLQVIFLIVSTVGLLTALGTVLARNLVHAALFLIGFFFTIACQFVLLEAEFMAAMQVLVYIGAVSILILFGIMLTRNIQGDETTGGHWAWKIPAGIVVAGLLAILILGIRGERGRPGQASWSATTMRPGGVNPRLDGPRSRAIAFSPVNKYLATADLDHRVRIWNPVDGDRMIAFHLPGPPPSAVAFSPEGHRVGAASSDGSVWIWNVDTRRLMRRLSFRSPGQVSALAIGTRDDNGRAESTPPPVAVGGTDGTVRLWGVDSLQRIEAHNGAVAAVRFTGDHRLITVGENGSVTLWDLSTGSSRAIRPTPSDRETLAVAIGPAPAPVDSGVDSDNGENAARPRVAIAESVLDDDSGGWNLLLLDAISGEEVAAYSNQPGTPTALALDPDGRRVAAVVGPAPDQGEGDEETDEPRATTSLFVWAFGSDAGNGEPIEATLAAPISGTEVMAMGLAGRRIALAGTRSPLSLYDPETETWLSPLSPVSATAAVIEDMPRHVGNELMTRSVIPFEVAGLLLTAALVGAIVLARVDVREAATLPGALAARVEPGAPTTPRAEPIPSSTGGNGAPASETETETKSLA